MKKRALFIVLILLLILISCTKEKPTPNEVLDNIDDQKPRVQNNENQQESEKQVQENNQRPQIRKNTQPIQTSVGITDPLAVFKPAKISLQAFGKPFKDTTFGTTLTRVGETERLVDDIGVQHWDRHTYSQLQAFNLDNSLIMLNNNNLMTFRDMNDNLKIVYQFENVINTPRWNPINKHEVYHFRFFEERVSLLKTNVMSGETETVVEYPEKYVNIENTVSSEELSNDGRWIVAYLFDKNDDGYFVAYDLIDKKFGVQLGEHTELFNGPCGKFQDRDNADEGGSYDAGPNWVRASPLGKMVIAWNRPGNERCRGIEVLDIKTGKYIGHVGESGSHSDVGLDKNGNEVYVAFYEGYIGATTFPGATSPNTFESNPEKPYFQVLLDPDYGHTWHLSCQGAPGVCVVTSEPEIKGNPFDDEIYLVYLDSDVQRGDNSNAKVRRLAHTRLDDTSCEVDGEFSYRMQPQASISRDGSYVVFASNWGKCGDASYSYLIDLRK
ncbi:hypothetical protein J4216_02570 [Candidatus Woesearchaeota archaeon]|nr:hypothetical protein [Candidatus Woesearchaeota archaeon]